MRGLISGIWENRRALLFCNISIWDLHSLKFCIHVVHGPGLLMLFANWVYCRMRMSADTFLPTSVRAHMNESTTCKLYCGSAILLSEYLSQGGWLYATFSSISVRRVGSLISQPFPRPTAISRTHSEGKKPLPSILHDSESLRYAIAPTHNITFNARSQLWSRMLLLHICLRKCTVVDNL